VSGGLGLRRRLRLGARSLAFIVIGLPQGLLYLVVVGGGLVAGAVLSLVWVGIPLVGATVGAVWRLADLERRNANRLLHAHLPPLAARPGRRWREALDDLSTRSFWRVCAALGLRLPATLAGVVAVCIPLGIALALIVLGGRGITGAGDGDFVGPWTLGPLTGLLLLAFAPAALVLSLATLVGVGSLLRAMDRALLGARGPLEGPVREMLAESLGDRTLSIAYWLPDRGIFVDERGWPAELPAPGSGRAWTAVEREGQRVAAIIHDEELDAGPELVHAAAATAALAIDNERLKADLRARVQELRRSRLRIVEAADDARRRLERDLHDGAQQQLVSLALDLRLLRARLADHEAAPLVDGASTRLAEALAELRELARGIHPAILSERGLEPAVEVLAERSPIPVEWTVDLDERPAASAEAAAYFVVSEGLTNVSKYVPDGRARVTIAHVRDDLEVVVQDDGPGGAEISKGSGLRGLTDRVSALEGTLALESEPGRGTRLIARIPWRVAEPAVRPPLPQPNGDSAPEGERAQAAAERPR
jgi:signal transduction histidine kinase